jgi:hypothetical protein
MADTDLNQLVDQLLDATNPRARREAARQLGALRDPMAISFLAQAYHQDSNRSVRRAAQEALLAYRRLEAEATRADGKTPAARLRLPIAPERLVWLRRLLTAILVVTVVVNLGLIGMRIVQSLADRGPARPQQDAPTPRETLIAAYQTRIAAIEAEATQVRPLFTQLQAEVGTLRQLPRCAPPPESAVTPVEIADIDSYTYPDLGPINGVINLAAQKLIGLRGDYVALCEIRDFSALDARVAQLGGPAILVQRLDDMLNADLGGARNALNRAITNPAPTVGPTITPTPLPTNTPAPTSTAAPESAISPPAPVAPGESDATPTALAVAPTDAPTATPVPTATPTLTPTPPPFVFTGLGLETLQRFRARLDVRYEGLTTGRDPFRGSLQVLITHQADPVLGLLDISLREGEPRVILQEGWLNRDLYYPGNTALTVADGVLYATGVIVRPPAQCTAARTSVENARALFTEASFVDNLVPGVANLGFSDLNAAGLTLVTNDGFHDIYRRTLDETAADGVRTVVSIEALVSLDARRLVRYTFDLQRDVPRDVIRQEITRLSVEYQLQATDGAVDVSGVRPAPACRGVPVR